MPDGAVYFLVMFTVILIGIFLLCQRCCRANHRTNNNNIGLRQVQVIPSRIPPRSAGVHRDLINSLPLIEFMASNGSSTVGSECAVCLGRFEDRDLLHLLPKCKHTFHIQCIDKWLESHTSCPMCRQNVDAQDLSSFTWLYGSWNSDNMPKPTQGGSESSVHQSDNDRQVSLPMSNGHSGSSISSVCEICLDRFEDTELVFLLPKCKHSFHVSCTSIWLERHSGCPICRQSIDTQDLSFTFIAGDLLKSFGDMAQPNQLTNENSKGQNEDPGQSSTRMKGRCSTSCDGGTVEENDSDSQTLIT